MARASYERRIAELELLRLLEGVDDEAAWKQDAVLREELTEKLKRYAATRNGMARAAAKITAPDYNMLNSELRKELRESATILHKLHDALLAMRGRTGDDD